MGASRRWPRNLIGLPPVWNHSILRQRGFAEGELWMIGGRTGDGKTALALQIAAANCRTRYAGRVLLDRDGEGETCCSGSGRMKARSPFSASATPAISTPIPGSESTSYVRCGKVAAFRGRRRIAFDSEVAGQGAAVDSARESSIAHRRLRSTHLGPAKDEKERLTKVSNALGSCKRYWSPGCFAVSQLSRPKDGNHNFRPNKFQPERDRVTGKRFTRNPFDVPPSG